MSKYATTAAFAFCFVVTGVPYWTIPYDRLNLPSSMLGPWLLVVPVAAAVLVAQRLSSLWKGVMLTAGAVPAAVMARVVVDGIADRTSHNLWPFELIIAFGVGFPFALAGGLAGSAVRRLFMQSNEVH